MMDALEQTVRSKKLSFIRIDGKTPQKARPEMVRSLQEDPNTRLALLSITACSEGLNLTAASVVVFCELYWVPGVMEQCEARAHRMGQASMVNVQYVCVEGSIDEKAFKSLSYKTEATSACLDGEIRAFQPEETTKAEQAAPVSGHNQLNDFVSLHAAREDERAASRAARADDRSAQQMAKMEELAAQKAAKEKERADKRAELAAAKQRSADSMREAKAAAMQLQAEAKRVEAEVRRETKRLAKEGAQEFEVLARKFDNEAAADDQEQDALQAEANEEAEGEEAFEHEQEDGEEAGNAEGEEQDRENAMECGEEEEKEEAAGLPKAEAAASEAHTTAVIQGCRSRGTPRQAERRARDRRRKSEAEAAPEASVPLTRPARPPRLPRPPRPPRESRPPRAPRAAATTAADSATLLPKGRRRSGGGDPATEEIGPPERVRRRR
eukprot:TRINITY_DN22198_c0_g3_i1.p1 TRINITY_DN22198_c0_g3~~TRINITY_DN22198_c0_g3_i1.p1  ORF type:complete len:515 (+),score=139.62 TRINITY_DN22198_c0_g3_i1:227-1546(+)